MMFVSKHTTIPVPQVFTIYQTTPTGQEEISTFIVMEYIPGSTLLSLWPTLTEADKLSITETSPARQLTPAITVSRLFWQH